ncbi:hypothetical protein I6F21_02565 [Bradyrhizobium sp. NBAIM03]|uniref:hypothetical protein n=1 Tax=Bradyrhizobium sp. NBAIM03 TaxID=2793816 RepID=UPI001CD686EE|nr:hypothetical protein [Bradyrhizobium sp. NBAIM03]MCA1531440.1 hypothetical protein [Bradyrhizobium sp. NBAIM03]
MTKHRPPPSQAEGREQLFEKLLAAMGIGEADHLLRFGLTQELDQIGRNARQIAMPGTQPDRRRKVQQYRAAITKVLAISETLGPDFFANEIARASLSRLNPDKDASTLDRLVDLHRDDRDNVVAVLTSRVRDIDHWLEISGDDYRKRDVRELVVEPFLRLMSEHGITTSRKQRPRKRIFDALFDWLGIEQRVRPTSANIDKIARDLEMASESIPKSKTAD